MSSKIDGIESKGDDLHRSFAQQFWLLTESTIYVDPDGDLTLLVGSGDHTATFCVSSKVMRLTSSVWRAMLRTDYGFKEAESAEHGITFPEDNAVAFFIVLLASHLVYQEIPRKIEYEQLLALCVFCDKYDCLFVIQPWISTWLKPLAENMGKQGLAEGWFTIAKILGDEESLLDAAYLLLRVCKTDNQQRCLTPPLKPIDGLPSELAGQYTALRVEQLLIHLIETVKILGQRRTILVQLLKACHLMIRKYSSSNHCTENWSKEMCNAFVLGYLVILLQRAQLWPGDPETVVNGLNMKSIADVYADIEGIHAYMKPDDGRPRC